MRTTVFVVSLALVIAGCMTPQYAAFDPTTGEASDLHLRVVRVDGSDVELRHAAITEDGITGTARGGRHVTVTTDQIRTVEQATGSKFTAAPAGAAIMIVFGLFALASLAACSGPSDSYIDMCPF
jgi:hypothetical protein